MATVENVCPQCGCDWEDHVGINEEQHVPGGARCLKVQLSAATETILDGRAAQVQGAADAAGLREELAAEKSRAEKAETDLNKAVAKLAAVGKCVVEAKLIGCLAAIGKIVRILSSDPPAEPTIPPVYIDLPDAAECLPGHDPRRPPVR